MAIRQERTAAVHAALDAALRELGPGPLVIIDVGGGTGGFAVPLAQAGHIVTVVDPNPDALAALARRASDEGVADRILGVQGDLDDLGHCVAPGSADVVVCHRVLEVVEDRQAAMGSLVQVLRPGGLLSLLVANRIAAVVHRALGGKFLEAQELLEPVRAPGPVDRVELETLITQAGLQVQALHGARVIADLVPGALLDDPAQEAELHAFEFAAADHPALREIATGLHALARLP